MKLKVEKLTKNFAYAIIILQARLVVKLIFERKSLIMIVAQGSNQVRSYTAGQCEEAD